MGLGRTVWTKHDDARLLSEMINALKGCNPKRFIDFSTWIPGSFFCRNAVKVLRVANPKIDTWQKVQSRVRRLINWHKVRKERDRLRDAGKLTPSFAKVFRSACIGIENAENLGVRASYLVGIDKVMSGGMAPEDVFPQTTKPPPVAQDGPPPTPPPKFNPRGSTFHADKSIQHLRAWGYNDVVGPWMYAIEPNARQGRPLSPATSERTVCAVSEPPLPTKGG